MEKQLYDKCQEEVPKYELTMNVKNKVVSVEEKNKVAQGQKEKERY